MSPQQGRRRAPGRGQRNSSRPVTTLILALISGTLFIAGFVFIGFYVWSSSGPHLRFLGASFLIACTAFAVGCLVGLIVGIPRFVSSGQLRHDVETRRIQAAGQQDSQSVMVAQQTTGQPGTVESRTSKSGAPTVPSAVVQSSPPPGVLVASGSARAAAEQEQEQTRVQGQLAGTPPPPANGDSTLAEAQSQQVPTSVQTSQLTPSTNLAEISDWLTKLLLGAGLVELTRLGRPLSQLVDTVARSMQNVAPGAKLPDGATVVAGGVLALYVVLGFLVSYVLTTLWYSKYLEQFD